MIALAVGLGVLGIFALRRARRRCYAAGYGWYGPWADYGGGYGSCDGACDGEHGEHGDGATFDGPGSPWMHARRDHHRHHHGARGGRWGGAPWMRGRRGRWMLHAALSRIDATPAQERMIVGEIERLREKVREARTSLDDTHLDLAAALRGPVLDDAALGAALGRIDGATGEVRTAALDALRNIHAALDDQQRETLADMLERRGMGGRGGGQGRGRGGGGAGWFRMGPYR